MNGEVPTQEFFWKVFYPVLEKYICKKTLGCSGKLRIKVSIRSLFFSNRGACKNNLTCSGKLQAFAMLILEFVRNFKPCPGILLKIKTPEASASQTSRIWKGVGEVLSKQVKEIRRVYFLKIF